MTIHLKHKWSKWRSTEFRMIKRGGEVDRTLSGQERYCLKCNYQQVRTL